MISLPAIFSDNMVLQRNKEIRIWGGSSDEKVRVSLADTELEVPCQDGSWMVKLPAMPAGGPYTLSVWDSDDKTELKNVMLGEVWIAGGQSNMELELANSLGGKEKVDSTVDDGIRYYYTPKWAWEGDELTQAEMEASWEIMKPSVSGRWSAVGYYFAEKLAKELGVTVGIIGCNWGGTSAACWTSEESLAADEKLRIYLDEYNRVIEGMDFEAYDREWKDYEEYQARFDKNVANYYVTYPNPTWEEAISLFGENKYPGPMGPKNWTRPCGLYNTMLKKVAPYTLAGCIYYQGEEDDQRPYTYRRLLTALIEQWRRDWEDEKLPFFIVQLPGFLGEGEVDFKNWPFIREAQMDVYKNVDNTGIAVTIELGDKRNIHPTDKKPVGERLANAALYQVYDKNNQDEAFAPMYCGCDTQEDKMYISFEYADAGLKNITDTIENFEIAGEDKKYYPAKARLVSSAYVSGEAYDDDDEVRNVIELSAADVQTPKYARYCWANYCEVTLFGKNGLPVAPFRTSREDGSSFTGSRNGLMV